jgi:hypothetical protein
MLKAMIWAVMVVPMSAPRMTPADWVSVMRPATVVTEEDWITDVTSAPVITPVTRLRVSRARMDFMRSPATTFRESAIWPIPYRKRARPPRRPKISWMGPGSVNPCIYSSGF